MLDPTTPNEREIPGTEEHVKRHPSNVQTGKILQDIQPFSECPTRQEKKRDEGLLQIKGFSRDTSTGQNVWVSSKNGFFQIVETGGKPRSPGETLGDPYDTENSLSLFGCDDGAELTRRGFFSPFFVVFTYT